MIPKSQYFIFLLMLSLVWSCQPGDSPQAETPVAETPKRIVSLGGVLTDVLVALDQTDQLVGCDITSTYPAEVVAELPKLGHISQLNAEAILALQPDIIFADSAQMASSAALQQLEESGVEVIGIVTSSSLDNSVRIAQQLQAHLSIDEQAIDALAQRIAQGEERLQAAAIQYQSEPKVLFIYARGTGRLSVAGTGTGAADVIEMAGGKNAISSFEGFKTLSAEALLEAQPDVILMFSSGLASVDGKEGLAQIPGISQTPAFQQDRVVAMDGHYLLAFGTQAPEAVFDLAQQIHNPSE